MNSKITRLISICFIFMMFILPIQANSSSIVVSGVGVTGTTGIYSTGGGGYKQARVETVATTTIDSIAVSGNYYIVNGYSVGNPSDSNRWSMKAYATLTYSSNKVMGCSTTHTANGRKFYTSDIY